MDRYDQEVERLLRVYDAEPEWWWEKFDYAWSFCPAHSPLFDDCHSGRDSRCGCLTQVRDDCVCAEAQTPELTAAIRADDRLPRDTDDIRRPATRAQLAGYLEACADWQRRLDRELNRQPPPMLEGAAIPEYQP